MEQHPFLTPAHDPAPPHTLDLPAMRERTAALLRAGVPLTLLLDLAAEPGPDSAAVYASEGGDARIWLCTG